MPPPGGSASAELLLAWAREAQCRYGRKVHDMSSDEEVGRQILNVFIKHKIRPSGTLRRNYFMDVRDADFQRGMRKAVEHNWIKLKLRDRYTYELTEAGFAAGSSD